MKKLMLVFFGVVLMMGLATSPMQQTQPTQAQDDGRLYIIATHSVLGDVVKNVAGDAADVSVLVPDGSDPHTFQLSAQDVVTLVEADVVFVNGAFFEGGLTDVFESEPTINAVVASQCVPVWGFGEHDHDHEEGEDHEHEEGEDHDHEMMEGLAALCESHWDALAELRGGLPEYYEETMGPMYALECEPHRHGDEGEDEGEHEHEHVGCDSHVWMDPHNGMLWTMFIRDTLIELDPANAATYTANADAYLAALNAEVDSLFALLEAIPQENRVLISNHLAFGYIANPAEFDTVVAVIPGGSTEGEASLQAFADLVALIESTGAPAIFSENTIAPDIIEQLADETGASVYLLLTGGFSPDFGVSSYIDYLRYNYTTIATALGER